MTKQGCAEGGTEDSTGDSTGDDEPTDLNRDNSAILAAKSRADDGKTLLQRLSLRGEADISLLVRGNEHGKRRNTCQRPVCPLRLPTYHQAHRNLSYPSGSPCRTLPPPAS
ncbi:hypothetical protein WCLP8_3600007 [uncultured Gammaproteobacteria bacterium]